MSQNLVKKIKQDTDIQVQRKERTSIAIKCIIIMIKEITGKKGLEKEEHKEKQIKNKANIMIINIIQIRNLNGWQQKKFKRKLKE